MKKKLFLLLRILVSFSLIGLILWLLRDKLPEITSTIKNADRGFLLAGILIYFVAVIMMALRLLKVISVQGIIFNLKEALYLTFIGYFFNNFLPTAVGGDLVKGYYAGKKSNRKGPAFAGVFMDRLLALIPFTFIPAITLIFCSHRIENKALIAAVYILFFSSLLLLWLLLHKNSARVFSLLLKPFREKNWYKRLREGYGFLNRYSKHKMVVLWSFALSLSAQAMWFLSIYFYARAVGINDVGLGIFFVVVPIVGVMSMLPSLNGLGVREGGFIYLLKAYMLPEKAFAISLLCLASLVFMGMIGGVIYALKKSTFSIKAES